MGTMIKRQQLDISHDLLLHTMKSITTILNNEELAKEETRTYKSYEAEFLYDTIYWELSQVEIHLGRLMKRIENDK